MSHEKIKIKDVTPQQFNPKTHKALPIVSTQVIKSMSVP